MCRPRHRLTAPLFGLATWAALGCGQETTSPTSPAEPSPSIAAEGTVAAATAPLQFSQVSSGGAHTCGVTADGRAYCWGSNFRGQLGDGLEASEVARARPAAVATTLRFRQISAGEQHTCAVTFDDLAYCWGDNFRGALGDKTTTDRGTPVAVLGGHRFRDIRAAFSSTCGVTTSNEPYCWGDNRYGQVGDNTIIQRLVPRLVRGGLAFRRIVPSVYYACGVTTADKAYCWGRNASGQLGDGTTTDRHLPTLLAGGRNYKNVSPGTEHACGFTSGGAVFCWGLNSQGQLGDGTTTRRTKPVLAKTAGALDGVTTGDVHSCALRNDGRVLCWGGNQFGQIGDATNVAMRTLPVQVVGDVDYDAIEAGRSHVCGLSTAGTAFCWGANQHGQLGRGTFTTREPFPQGVEPPL
jgi:alpha-tubulin suppressor-like RCC1 family protein